MPILYNNKEINQNSPFEEIAQYAIEKYYLIPYEGNPDKRPADINRFFHGGTHVSCTTLNLELCLALYRKFRPELLVDESGIKLDDEDVTLLKLAAIYHDSANTSEVYKHEANHAAHFYSDMTQLGFPENKTKKIAEAISHKNSTEVKNKNIYQKLLQSADCLDIIRVVGNAFNQEQLDIFHDLIDVPEFKTLLAKIVSHHKQFLSQFRKNNGVTTDIHKKCEFADNCYTTVGTIYFNSIKDILHQANITDMNNHHDVLSLYKNGLLVRMIKNGDIDAEITTLKQNLQSLEKANIATQSELKEYITKQETRPKFLPGASKVFTPEEFKWRPSSVIKQGLPIALYGGKKPGGVMIIISPYDQETFATYFYKTNIYSNNASNGVFSYNRTLFSRAKDKKHITTLIEKLEEIDKRRQGIIDDPELHYFGQPELEVNETLISYYKNIIGIGIIGYHPDDAKNALRVKLAHPELGFYRYTTENGLTLATDDEILQQSRSLNDIIMTDVNDANADQKNNPNSDIDLAEIKDIVDLSLGADISASNPLAFQFNYKEMACIARVSNSKPVIEYHQAADAVSVKTTNLLSDIAKKYYQEQVMKLNHFAEDDATRERIKTANAETLRFSLETKNKKTNLCIKLKTHLFDKPLEKAIEIKNTAAFADFFAGYPNSKINLKILPTNDIEIRMTNMRFINHLLKNMDDFIKNIDHLMLTIKSCLPSSIQEIHSSANANTELTHQVIPNEPKYPVLPKPEHQSPVMTPKKDPIKSSNTGPKLTPPEIIWANPGLINDNTATQPTQNEYSKKRKQTPGYGQNSIFFASCGKSLDARDVNINSSNRKIIDTSLNWLRENFDSSYYNYSSTVEKKINYISVQKNISYNLIGIAFNSNASKSIKGSISSTLIDQLNLECFNLTFDDRLYVKTNTIEKTKRLLALIDSFEPLGEVSKDIMSILSNNKENDSMELGDAPAEEQQKRNCLEA